MSLTPKSSAESIVLERKEGILVSGPCFQNSFVLNRHWKIAEKSHGTESSWPPANILNEVGIKLRSSTSWLPGQVLNLQALGKNMGATSIPWLSSAPSLVFFFVVEGGFYILRSMLSDISPEEMDPGTNIMGRVTVSPWVQQNCNLESYRSAHCQNGRRVSVGQNKNRISPCSSSPLSKQEHSLAPWI